MKMTLKERLAQISDLQHQKVERRMRTAVQIDEAMKARNISRKELADMMGRRPSEITKWLSGDHNFTSDTLAELSYYLQAKITGETPVFTATYVNVMYSNTLKQDFPSVNIDVPVSRRSRWEVLTSHLEHCS